MSTYGTVVFGCIARLYKTAVQRGRMTQAAIA